MAVLQTFCWEISRPFLTIRIFICINMTSDISRELWTKFNFYRTRVRSLAMLVTHSLTDWLTNSLPFSKLDWCEPGKWRWQLKTCWSCWWWETVYSVTFSIQFLTVLKSFSRLDSNSLTFLQLVKAVKTLTGGATWSIIYFDLVCTTNFPFLFLMAPVGKYMRWALSLPC